MPDASSTIYYIYSIATSTPTQALAEYSFYVLRGIVVLSVAYFFYRLISHNKKA